MAAWLILDCADIVGESVVYDDRQNALVWVDIGGKRIHRLGLSSKNHELWETPEFPTSIGLRRDGGAIVGLTSRVALWDFGGDFRTLAIPEPDLPDNRLDEGRVAPDGSFWVGTMQNNLNPDGSPKDMTRNSGAIYRIAPDGAVTQLSPRDYGISNTMAWTSDGRFLFADTLQNTIFSFALRDGRLGERSIFHGPLERGFPDGSCLDRFGRLWNCRVAGGSAIARFSAAGNFEGYVELPCAWPTSCAFGGPGLDRLYVTSARFTMSAKHLSAHPLEGCLFELDVGPLGNPEARFG
jgi:sugar lactone lactonase YvrE